MAEAAMPSEHGTHSKNVRLGSKNQRFPNLATLLRRQENPHSGRPAALGLWAVPDPKRPSA